METFTKHLLIIQDDPTIRRTLGCLFRHHGWTVATATTVAQGLELIDHDPSCIILDLTLPDGQGEAIIQKAKAANPAVRIIVTTNCTDQSRLATVETLSPHTLLHKPLNFSKVIASAANPNPWPSLTVHQEAVGKSLRWLDTYERAS